MSMLYYNCPEGKHLHLWVAGQEVRVRPQEAHPKIFKKFSKNLLTNTTTSVIIDLSKERRNAMFDDFDLCVTCEEYYPEEYLEYFEDEDEENFEEDEEREDFPDDYWLEMGFNPYEGCYDWDC